MTNEERQMNEWIVMCTRLCGEPIADETKLTALVLEGKSPLLNAFSKEFGQELVYSSELDFELSQTNVQKVFDILDRSFFNNAFKKFTDFTLYVGRPSQLNAIIQDKYSHNPKFDLSMFLAVYVPDIKLMYDHNKVKDLKLLKDAIFFNFETHTKATLAYVIATLCHEMIHCYDMRKGTLREKTKDLITHNAPEEVISYTAHFTPMFKSKREAMKNTHGITIQLTGDDKAFVDMNKDAAQEIQDLKEADSMREFGEMLMANPDYYNEKYAGFMHFDPETKHISFVFGQFKPGKSFKDLQ